MIPKVFSAVDDSLDVDYYFHVNVSDPVQFEDRLASISKIAAFNATDKYFATRIHGNLPDGAVQQRFVHRTLFQVPQRFT
jgi:hypothetical protein